MTQINPYPFKCPVCSKEFEDYVLLSTNQCGSSDLDTRPPEMMRSTMNAWIHECPKCGYVARDFDESPEITLEFLKSDTYQNIDFEFEKGLAEKFYKEYLILKQSGNTEDLYYPLLNCSWACDDAGDDKNACEIRKLCIDEISEDNETMSLIRLDLLRRSSQFNRAVEEYSHRTFSDEFLNEICTFQIMLAKSGDDGCYTVEDMQKMG
ncbi:MAG: hypothetical protein E7Z74_06880 [Methanobrevibacter millerae]|uniref:Uncharacterized protein n=1 Tax=Methanobrevibacter millerae TaxID=230361 RepID=A0A8T3VHJ5_9EURY|nr:hypothetical protein [Methanobrevibacter millerae]